MLGTRSLLGLESGRPLLKRKDCGVPVKASGFNSEQWPSEQPFKSAERGERPRPKQKSPEEEATEAFEYAENRRKRAKHGLRPDLPILLSPLGMRSRPLTPDTPGAVEPRAIDQDGVNSDCVILENRGKNGASGELLSERSETLAKSGTGRTRGEELEGLRTEMRARFRASLRWYHTALEDLGEYRYASPGVAPCATWRARAPGRDWAAEFECASDLPGLLAVLRDFDREYCAVFSASARATNRSVLTTRGRSTTPDEPPEAERPAKKPRGAGAGQQEWRWGEARATAREGPGDRGGRPGVQGERMIDGNGVLRVGIAGMENGADTERSTDWFRRTAAERGAIEAVKLGEFSFQRTQRTTPIVRDWQRSFSFPTGFGPDTEQLTPLPAYDSPRFRSIPPRPDNMQVKAKPFGFPDGPNVMYRNRTALGGFASEISGQATCVEEQYVTRPGDPTRRNQVAVGGEASRAVPGDPQLGNARAPARTDPRGDEALLRAVAALANATLEQKSEALWNIRGRQRFVLRSDLEALLTSQVTEEFVLLEAVVLAAAPHLVRDPATGRIAAARAHIMPNAWAARALEQVERWRADSRENGLASENWISVSSNKIGSFFSFSLHALADLEAYLEVALASLFRE